jgi:hypothetical protein
MLKDNANNFYIEVYGAFLPKLSGNEMHPRTMYWIYSKLYPVNRPGPEGPIQCTVYI